MKIYKCHLKQLYGIIEIMYGNRKLGAIYNPISMGKSGYILQLRKSVTVDVVDDV